MPPFTSTHHVPDFLAEIVSRTGNAAPKRSQRADRLVWLAFLGDTLLVFGAAALAFCLRFRWPAFETTVVPIHWSSYLNFSVLACLCLVATIAALGVYDRHLLLHFDQSATRIGKAWAYWFAGTLMATTMIDFEPSISRGYLILFALTTSVGLLLWRGTFHRLCRWERCAVSLRERVLLLGWNADAERLAQTMSGRPGNSYELIGWLPLPDGRTPAGPVAAPCLGRYSELTSILRYSRIDIVILTEHDAPSEDILAIIGLCERELVQFQLVPSFFRILLTGLHLHSFGGLPLLGVSRLPLNRLANRALKRSLDLLGGLAGLLLSAPLIATFAVLVYLESPGPIFYRQRRLGRKGRLFEILKIRSMRLDAEQDGQVGWSTKEDPRRLRIGSFMRRLNIDELPQFWNVLKGEMSLVGPRPERPELIAGFKHEIPHYNARHTVKPGITGWAQVHGLRGDTSLTERIRFDIYYLENWNVGLDLKILILTFSQHSNAC